MMKRYLKKVCESKSMEQRMERIVRDTERFKAEGFSWVNYMIG